MFAAAGVLLAVVAMQAPADTVRYQVVNHGRHAGTMDVVTVADTVVVHVNQWDRGNETNTTTRYITSEAGTIVRLEAHSGDAPDPVERFVLADGMVRWRTPIDSGMAGVNGPAFYWPRVYNEFNSARLAGFLLEQPQRTAELLPFQAPASAHVAVDTVVALDGRSEHVRLVVMEVPTFAPYLVWLDARGELFASDAAWLTTVRAGAESALPVLRSLERQVLARRSEAVARRLTTPRTGPLVIRNGNLFDSETATIRSGMTVVVEGERIAAVGAEGTVPVPAGATIIDATGKTVLAGLWDMHGHIDASNAGRNEVGGIIALADGITTIRDLAADVDRAVSFRDRAAAGTLISPRILLAGFMEGPGRGAGPTDAIVSTEDEAIEWVARYDSLGYRQIKVYNLVHPVVVATIAEEARKRGLRLSGHVPRGLSVTDVLRLGFNEIQHVSFLRRFFLPDSLLVQLQEGERLNSAARLAAVNGMDVDGLEATRLIEFLRDQGAVIAGTLNVWENRGSVLPDGADPLFGSTLEWLPPIARRAYTVAPTPAPPDRRLLQAKYHRFVKRLYDAGVTIVPGSDNIDFAYTGELEIYERAGIPAPDVLRIATLVPAQVMNDERDYGSIEPGKVADIIIVDGNPAEHVRDLRKVETVVRAGRVYSVRDLHAEVGVTPNGRSRR
jgi:imidazolonepropionase-like amidohydrolase